MYLPLLSALIPAIVLFGYIYWRDKEKSDRTELKNNQ